LLYKLQKVAKFVQILEAERYNHLAREVQPLNIGTTRKPTKKMYKK
jgi:hypothetical protein